jgi:hypothetical protein
MSVIWLHTRFHISSTIGLLVIVKLEVKSEFLYGHYVVLHSTKIYQTEVVYFQRSVNQLTPWSQVLPKKLIITQLIKFPAFYGT